MLEDRLHGCRVARFLIRLCVGASSCLRVFVVQLIAGRHIYWNVGFAYHFARIYSAADVVAKRHTDREGVRPRPMLVCNPQPNPNSEHILHVLYRERGSSSSKHFESIGTRTQTGA